MVAMRPGYSFHKTQSTIPTLKRQACGQPISRKFNSASKLTLDTGQQSCLISNRPIRHQNFRKVLAKALWLVIKSLNTKKFIRKIDTQIDTICSIVRQVMKYTKSSMTFINEITEWFMTVTRWPMKSIAHLKMVCMSTMRFPLTTMAHSRFSSAISCNNTILAHLTNRNGTSAKSTICVWNNKMAITTKVNRRVIWADLTTMCYTKIATRTPHIVKVTYNRHCNISKISTLSIVKYKTSTICQNVQGSSISMEKGRRASLECLNREKFRNSSLWCSSIKRVLKSWTISLQLALQRHSRDKNNSWSSVHKATRVNIVGLRINRITSRTTTLWSPKRLSTRKPLNISSKVSSVEVLLHNPKRIIMEFNSPKASNDWDKLWKTTLKAIISPKTRYRSTSSWANRHSLCSSRVPIAIRQVKCPDSQSSAKAIATEAKLNKVAHPNHEIIDNQINQILNSFENQYKF